MADAQNPTPPKRPRMVFAYVGDASAHRRMELVARMPPATAEALRGNPWLPVFDPPAAPDAAATEPPAATAD